MEVQGSQQHIHVDGTVKQLLDQAQGAIHASNANQALQCVIQALKLVRGDSAVLPTLRHAAEQYHAQRAAPIQEISELLAQVSLHAEQQRQQQPQQGRQQQQQQQQWQHLQSQQMHPYQQQQQQQQLPPAAWQQTLLHQQQQQQALNQGQDSNAILEETGRGGLADAALADGSSWQCPNCGGVVPQQRRQAHLDAWCPQSSSSAAGDAMMQ
ncbi:hypothetical protein OEZ85_005638 [Tetradesmus obliquus]|uniref:C2HC zinc finger plants domain-containing protein n=1 Tax=Tetradesmus obliquus TaxID=3088 RepID=A0ABY8UHC3_TETOB|nr:hypothetical protein OEZ85_005638 [Tetradesmus obliquus]